jgi:predicted XRE-type DNA-binding protein
MAGDTVAELIPFIKQRIKIRGECWAWTGAKTKSGYPTIKVGRGRANAKTQAVHRLMWEHFYQQEIPDGMFVMHSCDTPSCVNPLHLSIGTHAENMADMSQKGRARSGLAKLDADSIQAAQRLRSVGMMHKDIANEIGVSRSSVTKLLNGQSYRAVQIDSL